MSLEFEQRISTYFSKISLLSAYISVRKFNIFFSKTYVTFEASYDDENLETLGCNNIREDHLSNI